MKKYVILMGMIGIVGVLTAQVQEWRAIALEYMSAGDSEKSIPFYTQAVSMKPIDGRLRSELAYAYQLSKQYDTALNEYILALGLSDAPISDIKYNMGVIYSHTKQWKHAKQLYSEVIDLDSSYINAYLNRAIVYTYLEEYRNAEQDYLSVLELYPDHVQKQSIEDMIALLKTFRDFPVDTLDKDTYNKKLLLEEQLNNERERLEDNLVNNKYLGQ